MSARPAASRRTRVLIVQERLTHYRVPFFEQLRAELSSRGIDLDVAHGRGRGAMAARGDESELPWASVLDNRSLRLAGHELVWQPVLRKSRVFDLVVVEQASRMAVNYALLAAQAAGGPRVAFWGHGANLQADRSVVHRASEAAKARYSRLPHWWFAYTEGSAQRVRELGFPAGRITVVQNAVDTSVIDAVDAEREAERAIFIGGLYPEKRLDLLFAAADLIAARRPAFTLTVVGDGQLRGYVEAQAARRPYAEYLGARFGKEQAVELKSASVMVLPGAAGLSVLDAFAAGLPVVATAGSGHGPEIEYLENGVNGFLAERSATSVAAALDAALEPAASARLGAAGLATSRRVSLAEMVDRFAGGLASALTERAAGHA